MATTNLSDEVIAEPLHPWHTVVGDHGRVCASFSDRASADVWIARQYARGGYRVVTYWPEGTDAGLLTERAADKAEIERLRAENASMKAVVSAARDAAEARGELEAADESQDDDAIEDAETELDFSMIGLVKEIEAFDEAALAAAPTKVGG